MVSYSDMCPRGRLPDLTEAATSRGREGTDIDVYSRRDTLAYVIQEYGSTEVEE